MAIIRWDPFREMTQVQNQFNRLVDQVWNSRQESWLPAVDVFDRKDAVVLKAELAGMDPDDIEIEVEDNVLTIKGERKFEEKVEDERYYRVERRFGSFQRSLALPQGVKPDEIQAGYEDGILTVTVPKAEEEKPQAHRGQGQEDGRGHEGGGLTTDARREDRRGGAQRLAPPGPRRDGAAAAAQRREQRTDMTDRKHTTHDQKRAKAAEGRRGAEAAEAAAEAAEATEAQIAEAAAQAIADELAAVTRERDEYLDHLRRLKAEFDNYRKRVQRDNEELRLRAAETVVESLLPVMDNMSPRARGRRQARGGPARSPASASSPTSCAARWPATASRRSRSSRARRSTPSTTRRS